MRCSMKYLVIITGLLWGTPAGAQNTIRQYEYWFDDNLSGRLQQTIQPTSPLTLNTGLPAGNLSSGLHILRLRFRDDSLRYSSTISKLFCRFSSGNNNPVLINAIQYWFDNNFNAAFLQNINPAAAVNLSVTATANTLPAGLHFFHSRCRDNRNQWSSVTSQFFIKIQPTPAGGNNQVQAYQYWFDDQISQANTIAVSSSESFLLSTNLSAGNLIKGLHTFHLRFKDQQAQWSTALTRLVYIPGPAATGDNKLRTLQYWVDTLFHDAVSRTIPAQPVYFIDETPGFNILPEGLHTLHLRWADSTQQWSSTVSKFFYKSGSSTINTHVVTGYRYWYNTDDNSKIVIHHIEPQTVITLNANLDLGCLPPGSNSLHLQFRDPAGLWSSAYTDTIVLASAAGYIYRFTGNGTWSNAANWQDNKKPALDLPGCKEIIIDHAAGGVCILDVPQYLLKNARLTVLSGKQLVIPRQLEIK